MIAATEKAVYVVGKEKPDTNNNQPKADAKRIAKAVARTAKYLRKQSEF